MHEAILSLFPAHTHPLTTVSDPDGVLADEEMVVALAERGFGLLAEPDPVRLRLRVERARPFRATHPLIVVTTGLLEELPYDLCQQSHPVTLALHTFFPNLSYPVVRVLSPTRRWRLSQSPVPQHRLGRRASMDHVLATAFDASLDALSQPARLIAWLASYHQENDPMPALLADHLLGYLRSIPAYTDWALAELLESRDVFVQFVDEQWLGYVQQETSQLLSESPVRYILSFEGDGDLQDTVPSLVRSGTLAPLVVDQPERLPRWARPALLASDEDLLPRRLAELLSILADEMRTPLAEVRWARWQAIAHAWAELNTLRHHPNARLDSNQRVRCQALQEELDATFPAWLQRRYAPLAGQRLPVPHHLFHTPHYMAYQRRQTEASRVALLILDGMSLEDWTLIGPAWRARHPNWRFQELLLIAQIPTVTSISRQAMVSGLLPADLPDLGHNRRERQQWAHFWSHEGFSADLCSYDHLNLDRQDPPSVIDNARVQALCLTDTTLDDMVHSAGQGAVDVQASLRLWLEDHGRKLERVIAGLLAEGYQVYVGSDHGHTEAQGMGRPSEGLTVDTRGKRARVYSDRRAAASVQQGFAETILWSQDGLLPDDVWVLMPEGRRAFATPGQVSVTHGGPTLDEVVVPLVTITRS